MNQPFVISMKAYLDAAGVKAGSKEAERYLSDLNRQAARSEVSLRQQIERNVGMGAGGRGFRQAEADIAAYGKQLDDLRARYNPLFAAHQRYRQSLAEIRQARDLGAISADEMSAAISRERQAALASIAAIKGRTNALYGMTAASERLTWQQRNLMYQMVDVGQMFALQQPLHMLLLQQGPQIAQIYGPDEGGVGRAFSEMGKMARNAAGGVLRLAAAHPVAAAAIVATSGALIGFTHEIDKTTKKSVSMADVIVASFQVIVDGLYSAYIKPFEIQIQGLWDWLWSGTVWLTKTLFNSVVVTIGSASLGVEYATQALWVTLKALAANVQNFFVDALQSVSDFVTNSFNSLIDGINGLLKQIGADKAAELFGLPGQIQKAPGADFSGKKASYSDFESEIAGLNSTYSKAFDKLFTEDHAGKFFDAVRDRVIKNLTKVDKEAAKLAAKLKAAYDRIVTSTKQRIEGLQLEATTLGMTEEAANRLRYAQDLINQATNAGIKLTADQTAELTGLAARLAAAEERVRRLREAFDFGQQVTRSFFADLKSNLREGKNLFESFGGAVTGVFDRIADRALQMAADGIWNMIWGAVPGALGGGLGGLGNNIGGGASWSGIQAFVASARGNVFDAPSLSSYLNTVVSKPTVFPFAKGIGLMGEAGHEAIMPLTRNARGQLGVQAVNDNAPAAANGNWPLVQIIDQRGSGRIDRQEATGPNGEKMLRLIVRDEVRQSHRRAVSGF